MNSIIKCLKKSEIPQRVALVISQIFNLSAIAIFIMFCLGVNDIFNETLSPNDAKQIEVMLSSVVSVAVISVVFLQWIICIISKSIFMERQKFNINMRLIGASSKVLKKIYINEAISIQAIVVPIGLILAEALYFIVSDSLPNGRGFIGLDKCIIALVIHFLTLLISLTTTFKNLSRFDVVDEIRGTVKNIRIRDIEKFDIIKFFIGLLIFISSFIYFNYFVKISGVASLEKLIAYFISFLFIYDLITLLLYKFVLFLSKKFKFQYLFISQLNTLGSYKKVKHITIMLVLSLTICTGVQSLFSTARLDVYQTAILNVGYENKYICKDFVNEDSIKNEFLNEGVTTGITLRVTDATDKSRTLIGVGGDYCNNFENLVIDEDISNINLIEKFSDPDFNGIILPSGYINKNSIGKEYKVTFEGEEFTFIVAGAYYRNEFDKFSCFVSKSYLQKLLGNEAAVNTVFTKLGNEIAEKCSLNVDKVVSKKTIATNNYNKVISSSLLIEIVSFIVLICSILMLVSLYIMQKRQVCIENSRLRGLGVKVSDLIRIYSYKTLNFLFISLIFSLYFSREFCNAGRHLMMEERYLLTKSVVPVTFLAVIMVMLFGISLITFLMSSKESLTSNYINILREN